MTIDPVGRPAIDAPELSIQQIVADPPWLQRMYDEYVMLKRQTGAILTWQMGDFFEFYFKDAETVAAVLTIALSQRGQRPNGEPIPMCAVPADARFSAPGRLLIPLTPTDHFFGAIVRAGHSLSVAVGDLRPQGHSIVATFHPGDFPREPVGNVVPLIRKAPRGDR